MPKDADRPAVYPLVEKRLEKIELYLKTMTTTRMREIIIEDYRNHLMARLESLLEPPSDEQIRQLLKLIEPPELVLVRAGVIPMPRSSKQPNGSKHPTDDPVPRFPVLGLAERGLYLSVISIFVSIGASVYQVAFVQSAIQADSIKSAWFYYGIAIVVSVVKIAIAIVGICVSFKALIGLRKENGRFAGYRHATAGVVLGAIAVLVSIATGILLHFMWSDRVV